MQLNRFIPAIICLMVLSQFTGQAQVYHQVVYGRVLDSESHQAIVAASVVCETCHPVRGCATDSAGYFKMEVPVGRHNVTATHIAYLPVTIKDIQAGTGKAVVLNIEMHEQVFQTRDISVNGSYNRWINPMASVSVRSLRSQDAARYAAGYFDPSRMVTNFAGVAVSNSDDKNEIIVRGNSPRGLLWRLEGIEIPNPNHFANGEGASGGSYTAITTNVLSTFDFFTGSFPAEYGNALSGVMDLNLRTGSTEKHEYSVMLSVLGTELSAEGPFKKNSGNSFLADFRIANFKYLKYLGAYTEDELGIIPKTKDWVAKATIKTKKAGTFNFFTLGGNSSVGDIATADTEELQKGGDSDEYKESHELAIAGVKHLFDFTDNRSYIRSTLAYTYELTSDINDQVDTTMKKTVTYNESFRYPALRFASVISHKLSSGHSVRAGVSFNCIFGDMFARRLLTGTLYDTLIDNRGKGWYSGAWAQWKYKSQNNLETNTGIHVLYSGINRELAVEPRFGLTLQLSEKNSFNLGSGLFSRLEPLSIYFYRVRIDSKTREPRNKDLKTTKAFHITAGFNQFFNENLHLNVEGYFQYLYDVPIRETPTGQYSILNSSEGLPDVILANKGKGKNTGLEITLEKTFSHNYYFLATASLFDSKYKAPDGYWYNTYYNSNYVFNLQSGKEFPLGKYHQNVLGFRLRGIYRGGFRYTPVNEISTLKNKRIIYETWNTYGESLPGFKRLDMGLTYRINKKNYAWMFLCDIQNIADTRNILRRQFAYQNKAITILNSKSIGMVPIVSVKVEF